MIALRPIDPERDVDAVLGWINDPEVTRNFAAFSDAPVTRDAELAFLRGVAASPTDRLYAVVAEDTGAVIGTAGIHKIYWPARNGRIGLMIGHRALHGRGIGTAALRALVAVGFGELGLHKLWAVHYADNQRMAHLFGKLGFVREGLLRDEYFHRGAFHDMVRWSRLAGDPPAPA